MAGSFCVICRARIPKGSRCAKHAIKSPSTRSSHERGAQRVRQQVLARDDGCAVCGTTENLEVHHLKSAADGGPLSVDNLVVFCRRHHLEAEAKRG